MRVLVWLVVLCICGEALAFPELIRHGYTNCTTCHVSPSGGGLLTPYGRSLSKELLSRWSYEGEENFLHGAIQKERVMNWLNGNQDVGFNIGGDIRYLQQYTNSDYLEKARFFPMQRDLEVAFKAYKLTLVSTAGYKYLRNESDEFETRRYYALYQATENLSLRLGRFLPIYGLMIADHYTDIKSGLQFDQGRERDNAEINYINDNLSGTLTYSQSPQSAARSQPDTAFSAQVNYAVTETHRVGANYWQQDGQTSKRNIFGLTGLFGFTHEFYALSEVDFQVSELKSNSQITKGIYYYQKLGYEMTRGVHAILQVNGSQSDFDKSETKGIGYGVGMNLYPRPHFELQALWSHIDAATDMDMAFLIGHYYF